MGFLIGGGYAVVGLCWLVIFLTSRGHVSSLVLGLSFLVLAALQVGSAVVLHQRLRSGTGKQSPPRPHTQGVRADKTGQGG